MTTRTLALLVLLGCMSSAGAFRVMGQPERPFELTLGQVTLPRDTGGSVTLRECDNCRMSTRRFIDDAAFRVDGRAVRYADFLQMVTDLRASPTANATTVVNVFVDVVTEKVTRIAINRPRR
jgi:hypothetical protein